MDRLTTYAGGLINHCQTAFIKGRYIGDGAVMLHEIMYEMKKKKMTGVVLKIDFEKTYGSVRWDFVERLGL